MGTVWEDGEFRRRNNREMYETYSNPSYKGK